MNCYNAEKNIYLYRELNEHEKTALQIHLNECHACRAIATDVWNANELLISFLKPVPTDSFALTQKIMDAVQKKEVNKLRSMTVFAESYFLKASLGMVSVVLLAFFIFEIERPEIRASAQNPVSGGPVLNMNVFRNAYAKHRSTQTNKTSRYTYHKNKRIKSTL